MYFPFDEIYAIPISLEFIKRKKKYDIDNIVCDSIYILHDLKRQFVHTVAAQVL